jgi:hypothetical protein
MSYWRSLLLAAIAGSSVFFTSASRVPPTQTPVPPPVYPLTVDLEAAATLDQAIASLDPARLPWLQTAIWQEISVEPLTFQAEGTYQAGPNRRARVDMEVRNGRIKRSWRMICDGEAIWEIDGAESDKPRWQKRLLSTDQPGHRSTARPDAVCVGTLVGPRELLEGLKRDVEFTHLETVRWRGKDVILLTGARPQPKNGWSDYQPRQCRLALDAAMLWPHRVEWWGPAPGMTGDIRLIQIEFRNPVPNHPVDPSQFTFIPPPPEDDDAIQQRSRRNRFAIDLSKMDN